MRHAFLLLFVLSVCAPVEGADARAVGIGRSMVEAMGGHDAWNRARFLRFDFRVDAGGKTVADRAHLWDRQTGRYRLENAGQVVLFNTATQQGTAYKEGKKLDDPAAAAAVKQAYGSFINDFYWLAMPWKWMDAGVHLKYSGKRSYKGREFDVVELTFDKVGLTPGDKYLAFVSPETRLMEHWEYTLQSGNKGSWDWTYTTGLKLARSHTGSEGRTISHGNPRVLDSVDDAYFSDAGRVLAGLK